MESKLALEIVVTDLVEAGLRKRLLVRVTLKVWVIALEKPDMNNLS